MRKVSSPTTGSAQITNRWLQVPPIVREKSNAVSGGSPPNSDTFSRHNVIASSASRSSPVRTGSVGAGLGIRSRAAGARVADKSSFLMDRTQEGLLHFAVNPIALKFPSTSGSSLHHAGRIFGAKRGGARSRAQPPLVRESRVLPCTAVTAWIALMGDRRV